MGRGGSGWIWTGNLLALGVVMPGVALKGSSLKVSGWGDWSALLLAQDVLFMLCVTAFVLAGEQYGRQRHPDAPPYPGPFVETSSERRMPAYFVTYVVGVWALPAVLVPCGGIIWLACKGQIAIATATLIPYLLILIAQCLTEEWFKRRRSAMWPQVPVVYMMYRFWQLLRSVWLSTLLPVPRWLDVLQDVLIVLWTFNFGAVMTWMPWLYRWHMQPQQSKSQ